ncbi:MAG: hypothetical protein BJ554DRAFT_8264 [Olpidium bornovanus]|uniref:Uncharacterized protein n=1 Tax=Olpidium bornovanus TaxID=278681 RepID=A0A8H7ZUU8_9FUNG|nr:MAG: hypothetical protein BJ554DRAFT_8264 [Olpidium bornovanus]
MAAIRKTCGFARAEFKISVFLIHRIDLASFPRAPRAHFPPAPGATPRPTFFPPPPPHGKRLAALAQHKWRRQHPRAPDALPLTFACPVFVCAGCEAGGGRVDNAADGAATLTGSKNTGPLGPKLSFLESAFCGSTAGVVARRRRRGDAVHNRDVPLRSAADAVRRAGRTQDILGRRTRRAADTPPRRTRGPLQGSLAQRSADHALHGLSIRDRAVLVVVDDGTPQAGHDALGTDARRSFQTRSWWSSRLDAVLGKSPSAREELISGALSGTLSKIAVYPVDTIRKRMQIQGPTQNAYAVNHVPTYPKSIKGVFAQILRDEGPLSLYKGLTPAILKAAPASAITFLVYERTAIIIKALGL